MSKRKKLLIPAVVAGIYLVYVVVPKRHSPWGEMLMYHDGSTGKMMVFQAGFSSDSGEGTTLFTPMVWSWDGEQWVIEDEATGLPEGRKACAYDRMHSRLVVVPQEEDSTWLWDGASWERLAGAPDGDRHLAVAFFHHGRGTVMLGCQGHLYEFRDQKWHELDGLKWPGKKVFFPLLPIFDTKENRTLAYAWDIPDGLHLLYEVDETGIATIAKGSISSIDRVPFRPMPPFQPVAMVFDEEREIAVLVLTQLDVDDLLVGELVGDEFRIVPSQNAPGYRRGVAFAYDPTNRVTMMYGGIEGSWFQESSDEMWELKYLREEDKYAWRRLN